MSQQQHDPWFVERVRRRGENARGSPCAIPYDLVAAWRKRRHVDHDNTSTLVDLRCLGGCLWCCFGVPFSGLRVSALWNNLLFTTSSQKQILRTNVFVGWTCRTPPFYAWGREPKLFDVWYNNLSLLSTISDPNGAQINWGHNHTITGK